MHEFSIINSVMKTLEMEFEETQLKKLKVLYLKVGILSNIEPRLLLNAFDAYILSKVEYKKVKLEIESTNIKIKCEDCSTITEVEQYKFICKKCGNPSKNLIQGEEMLIHKVDFFD